MRWRKSRASNNVIRAGSGRRALGPVRGRHVSLGGLVIIAILSLVFHRNLFGLLGLTDMPGVAPGQQSTRPVDDNDPQVQFVRHVLGSTEDGWSAIFQQHGMRYGEPKLVLFRGAVDTACGSATSAVGPFYCPGDERIYLDLDFFDTMQHQLHASTADFARAYVIAHEVGHHVQNLIGVSAKVGQARRQGAPLEGAEGLSVRQELQADCFAGVWAAQAQKRLDWLQPGDIEAALDAAHAIGDDTLQREARGTVMPDSFTHGTSAERVRWFSTGFRSGDMGSCDTFGAARL